MFVVLVLHVSEQRAFPDELIEFDSEVIFLDKLTTSGLDYVLEYTTTATHDAELLVHT